MVNLDGFRVPCFAFQATPGRQGFKVNGLTPGVQRKGHIANRMGQSVTKRGQKVN